MPWKDKKKRYNSDEIESSEINLGHFRLSVHRHISCPPDVWLASCLGLYSQIELASKDLSEAKRQAIAKVQKILEEAIKAILEA
jgi:hypothetical protein